MRILLDISGTGTLQFPSGRSGKVDYTLTVREDRGMKSGSGALHGDFSLLFDAQVAGEMTLVVADGRETQIVLKTVDMQSAKFLTTGRVFNL